VVIIKQPCITQRCSNAACRTCGYLEKIVGLRLVQYFKRFLYSILLILSLLFLTHCYLAKQGAYLFRYNSEAEDIDIVLRDEELPEDERNILLLVKDIKKYAEDVIGLKKDKNYSRYVRIERDYLVDVVSACEKDRFEPYLWKFPFFGAFPYKGFYEKKDAEKEAEKLRKKDLDVYIRKVDAFSTLGFMVDPVYSFMKDYSVFSIASLIIHEQTHATIFLKNNVQFNEEIATFVGNEGALQFIIDKYGYESEYNKKIVTYQEDIKTYLDLIHNMYKELNRLYERDLEKEYKLLQREKIFGDFRRDLEAHHDQLFMTESFIDVGGIPLNNAYIMSLMRYTQDLSLYYELYDLLDNDLNRTVAVLKKVKKQKGNPKEYLRRYMESLDL
jgi:predicted aminopeptidase